MRILLVSDYGTRTGGAENALFALRDGLLRRGHEVRFVASRAAEPTQPIDADYVCAGTLGRFRTLLQCCNPDALRTVRRALKDFRPDVVHVGLFLTQLSPLILLPLKNVPALYHVHWLRPICPIGVKCFSDGTECHRPAGTICYSSGCVPARDLFPLMAQMRVWRKWSNTFRRIVTVSEFVARRLEAEKLHVTGVVPNGVPNVPRRPPLTGPPTVAFAGRLVRLKGADVLIRAFARVVDVLPQARLLIAGSGPEDEHLRALAREQKIASQVDFLGFRTPAQMETDFAGAWVQAVPSLCPEAFGLSAAEALMRGTAAVATTAGGLREIVEHERTGLLVPPNDPEALAQALLRCLTDREFSEALGAAGAESARMRFSLDGWIDRFVECYRGMLDEARR